MHFGDTSVDSSCLWSIPPIELLIAQQRHSPKDNSPGDMLLFQTNYADL